MTQYMQNKYLLPSEKQFLKKLIFQFLYNLQKH